MGSTTGVLAWAVLASISGTAGAQCLDLDVDGYCAGLDCDDANRHCTVDCNDGDRDGFCDEHDNCPADANPLQGAGVKLNGTSTASAFVNDFSISPDNTWVVYRADQDTVSVSELYSVPIVGGIPVRLNPPLVVGRDVDSYTIVPDSSRVFYLADHEAADVVELFSAPISGGAAVQVNPALVAGGDVLSAKISPDGSRCVYTADQQTNNLVELYSAPVAGGPPTKLSAPLVAAGDVLDFTISADSSRVVYHADQDIDEVFEVYSVPLAGGHAVKLNDDLVTGQDVESLFTISPDGSWVLFQVEGLDGLRRLFRAPLAGGTPPVVLNAAVLGPVYVVFSVTPDGTRAVFSSAPAGANGLYSVPLTGGIPVQLGDELASDLNAFRISPDGSRVVYRAEQDAVGLEELYSVPLAGGVSIQLNGILPPDGDVSSQFAISPDSSRVTYVAGQHSPIVMDLFSVPLAGGLEVQLNLGIFVFKQVISADGAHVVYRSDQDVNNVHELYSVPLGGGWPIKLNGPFVAGGTLAFDGPSHPAWQLSGDSTKVVYLADQDTDNRRELYSVPLLTGDGVDLDLDGFAGACDCFNADHQVWQPPGEVLQLTFGSDKVTLIWDPVDAPGATSVVYDALRSAVPADFTDRATCLESDDGTDTTANAAEEPAPGMAHHYLVRAQNNCPSGEGSLGADSDGVEREGRSCP